MAKQNAKSATAQPVGKPEAAPASASQPQTDWDDDIAAEAPAVSAPVSDEAQLFSQRPGDIVTVSGIVKFNQVHKMPRAEAEALCAQFSGLRIL